MFFLWGKVWALLASYKQVLLIGGLVTVFFFGARKAISEHVYDCKATHSKEIKNCVALATSAKEQNQCFTKPKKQSGFFRFLFC